MKPIILAILLTLSFVSLYAQKKVYPNHSVELEKEYTSGVFRTNNAFSFVPTDDPAAISALNIFEYLQGKVAGLSIKGAGSLSPSATFRFSKVAYFVDQMPVDNRTLATVNMNDIAFVKVFRPPFIGAQGAGSGGAIAVYTKHGEEEE